MGGITFVDTPPRVFLVGISTPTQDGIERYLAHRATEWNTQDGRDHPEALIELAGRVCYQSFHNPAGKTRTAYIQNMFEHGHGSTSEHLSVNLMVADLPRSTQLELVRHGDGTGFSFESTRFTDAHMRFVVPPGIRDDDQERELFTHTCIDLTERYLSRVGRLTEKFKAIYPDDKLLARKRAKEAARSLLPNCQGSDGMVTMNVRALRWIIQVRSDEHADESIREFAHAVYEEVAPHLPATFIDASLNAVRIGTPEVVFAYKKV